MMKYTLSIFNTILLAFATVIFQSFPSWQIPVSVVVFTYLLFLNTVLQWFYGFYYLALATIALVTMLIIFIMHEHGFVHLKIKNHTLHTFELFAKNIVFFYVALVVYGFAYLYEAIHFFTAVNLFWWLFISAYLLMWQAHHKYERHTLRHSTMLALSSWFVALYGWFVYTVHLPHVAGSLLISVCYGIVWSIFLHYVK